MAEETPKEGEIIIARDNPELPQAVTVDPLLAQDILAKEKKARADRCMDKIITILQEENCRADPKIIIVGETITYGGIEVTAYDGVPQKAQEGANGTS
jgi:hypothetical protein